MCYEYMEFTRCETCDRNMSFEAIDTKECSVAKNAGVSTINCPNGRETIETRVDGGDCGACMSEKAKKAEEAAKTK